MECIKMSISPDVAQCSVKVDGAQASVQGTSMPIMSVQASMPAASVYHECDGAPAPSDPDTPSGGGSDTPSGGGGGGTTETAPAYVSGYVLVDEDENEYDSATALYNKFKSVWQGGSHNEHASSTSSFPVTVPSSGIAFVLSKSGNAGTIKYVDGIGVTQSLSDKSGMLGGSVSNTVSYKGSTYKVYAMVCADRETVSFVKA